MPYLLGIDIGTSGTKALLLSLDGKVVSTQTVEHTLQTPRPGWTEQNPEEWWNATQKAVRTAMRQAKLGKDDIRAVGLSGQMHGSVFLDKAGKAIRPALLWNDQRTVEQSGRILDKAGGPDAMLKLVGNLPLTGYTAPKILWFRDHEPKKFAKCVSILLPKDFIRFRMTGDYATDMGDASGTALLDVKKRQWSDALLKMLDIDAALLPKLYESPEVTGTVHADAAKALGLAVGTPVVAGAGDVMSGAVGNGIVEKGTVNANLGTGGVMCAHSDKFSLDPRGRIATMCHAVPGAFVNFGCMLSAAGSLQWYADTLAEHEQAEAKRAKGNVFELLMEQAERAPAGSEGLFFLPYLTGERCPHPDPDARGCWIGLTRRTDKAAVVRSLMEGVTFNMGQMLAIMRDEMKIPVKQVRATGGGSKAAVWRQMQADVYNAPVALTNSEEGGAFGVALLAGVGSGEFKSVSEACAKLIQPTETLKPKKKQADLYKKHAAVYAKLYDDLKDRFAEIGKL